MIRSEAEYQEAVKRIDAERKRMPNTAHNRESLA